MIKKLFSTVLLSLLCGGLLFSGGVDAMSYVVEGTETVFKIKAGENGVEYEMMINWGDGGAERSIIHECLFSGNSISQGVAGWLCEHEYNDGIGSHTVTVTNPNKKEFDSLYIAEGNVKQINDFSDFENVQILHLNNNNISIINQNNIFSSFNNLSLHLEENLLSDFSPSLNNITNLYLKDNQLTTIPKNIWDARCSYKIYLTTSIAIGNSNYKKIYLDNEKNGEPDNKINFVGITKSNNGDLCDYYNYSATNFSNTTDYRFERFGFKHNANNGNITYNYKIKDTVYSGQVSTSNGAMADVTIDNPLKPGNYTFEVCLDGTNKCDSIDFNVSYDVGIEITIPSQDQEIDNVNDAVFQRNKTGQYPDQFLSGYGYELKYNNNISIYQGTTSGTSFSIPADLIQQYGDGKYTLFVYLLDSDGSSNGNQVYDSATYTINTTPSSDIKVTITAPKGTVTSSSTVFSREGQVSQPNSLGQSGNQYIITGYDRKLYTGNNTDTNLISSGNVSTTDTTYSMNYSGLTNGEYILEVDMNFCKGNSNTACNATKDTSEFEVQLSTGDAKITITKPTTGTLTSKIQEFIRSGDAGKNYTVSGYYYKLENTSTNQIVSQNTGSSLKSFTENNLTNGNYKLTVVMYIKDGANNVKTVTKSETYKVDLSESDVKLEITNPKTDGSKIDSKSATLTRSGTAGNNYAISGYYYKLENTDKNEIVIQNSGNVTSFSKSDFSNGNYKLTVTMYYKNGTSNIKEKTEIRTFTVSIKSSGGWSGGGGGGSSGKSHKTNEIQLSTDTPNPSKNQGVNLTIKTNDYTGKLTFSAKYRPDTSSSRTDISNNTSSNYYGNYSNIWEEGYYTMKSSDDGEKKLKNLVEFQKEGYYRIYVTDDQGTTSYTEFHIGNTDEERYIARSCKKYKLTYNNSLSVRTSPNLNKNEYFVNTDYFKRYIDSKNAQIDGCPTNDPRISNTYQDTTNRDDKYTAPNGKVYFINNKNGKYQSDELDYPSKLFNTLSEIKYYIRDRNPFIGMARTK